MRMDPTITRKKTNAVRIPPGLVLAGGLACVFVALLILGLSVWEAFGGARGAKVIQVPGFHELQLEERGLYAGIYQHRGTGPVPTQLLSKMDVRVLARSDYQEVPVLMNNTGQVIERMGFKGMVLFNFIVERPGDYSLSAFSMEETGGKTVPILIVPQTLQNVRPTLVVGGLFFLLFGGAGVLLLVKASRLFAKKG